MDLWDLTRLLLRRWYFAVPMLLASVAVVVLAAMSVSPDYKATGHLQMIPPPSAGKPVDPQAKPRPTNPWLDLGYAALGNAAALTVTEPSSLEQLAKRGYSDSVTVTMNNQTVLFEIEAIGSSRQQATDTVREIIRLIQEDIVTKQTKYGTLAVDTISTLVLNDGATTSTVTSKIKRVLIVAAGVGLLLTAAATILLDSLLRRRARRKASREAAGDDAKTGSGSAGSSGGGVNGRADDSGETQVIRIRHSDLGAAPASVPTQSGAGNGGRRLGLPSVDYRNGENGAALAKTRRPPAEEKPKVKDPTADRADVDATIVLPVSYTWREPKNKT